MASNRSHLLFHIWLTSIFISRWGEKPQSGEDNYRESFAGSRTPRDPETGIGHSKMIEDPYKIPLTCHPATHTTEECIFFLCLGPLSKGKKSRVAGPHNLGIRDQKLQMQD